MSNPFDRHRSEEPFQAGELKPGDTRIIHAKDRSGNIVKTITVYRTEREYVHDLCDAYNAVRTEAAKERGIEWYVGPGGELKIGDNAAWSRAHAKQIASRTETERARFIRHQLEHTHD